MRGRGVSESCCTNSKDYSPRKKAANGICPIVSVLLHIELPTLPADAGRQRGQRRALGPGALTGKLVPPASITLHRLAYRSWWFGRHDRPLTDARCRLSRAILTHDDIRSDAAASGRLRSQVHRAIEDDHKLADAHEGEDHPRRGGPLASRPTLCLGAALARLESKIRVGDVGSPSDRSARDRPAVQTEGAPLRGMESTPLSLRSATA